MQTQLNNNNKINSNVKQPVALSSAPKKISKIQFSTLTSNEISKISEISVTNRELFVMPNRNPASLGVMDCRLGISEKKSICGTCK